MIPVYVVILVPLIGAFLVGLVPARFKPALALTILGIALLASVYALSGVLANKELSSRIYSGEWISLSFIADGLAVFMAFVSLLVSFLICVYSLEYMKEYKDRGDFYFWTVLFIGAMMGLVFSGNLLLLFCFWEITSVCSWKLIGFHRSEKDTKSADKAFLVTFLGAALMLAGIIFIYLTKGTLDINILKGISLNNVLAFLLLGGIISKSAQIPFQTWLPDAGVAPTPVTALLHAAVLVKIGVYVFARFFSLTFVASPLFMNAVIILSVFTIIVAAGSALVENNMKRILAYSTTSQLGYILLILALNTDISLKVALVYILAHSLAKAGLFLCAGIIEHKTGTKDINRLGGLLADMPFTALAYLLCAFSVIGMPPFLGFWPKFIVVFMAIKEGQILAGSLAIIGALFTLFYLMRLFEKVFLGEIKIAVKEKKFSPMVIIVMILGILSLLLGLGGKISLPFNLVSTLIKS